MAVNVKSGYGLPTVPVGGAAFATTSADSLILRLTCALAMSGGMDESVTVIDITYVPAVDGVPDNPPEACNIRPGGREPDSLQFNGGVPPEAVNV